AAGVQRLDVQAGGVLDAGIGEYRRHPRAARWIADLSVGQCHAEAVAVARTEAAIKRAGADTDISRLIGDYGKRTSIPAPANGLANGRTVDAGLHAVIDLSDRDRRGGLPAAGGGARGQGDREADRRALAARQRLHGRAIRGDARR